MKRVLALVLSVILLLGCSTVAVSAAGSDEIKDGYHYGEVLVKLSNQGTSVADILTGFEIETVRLLTPGSSAAVYQVIFTEKTKDIVWKAIDILNQREGVQVAEPNYIGQYLPVDDSASGKPDDLSKLSAALIEKLSAPGVEQVDVCIFLKSCIRSEAEVERIISEKYTWTTQQEHLMYWRKEVSEMIGAYVQQFIDEHGELLDAVIWRSDAVEMIEATVSKENIAPLAALDTVSDLDLFVDAIPEPDIDEMTTVLADSSKLLPDLQKAMTEKAPDDEIGVYISYNVPVVTAADMPSWPDIYAARKEYFAYSDQMQAEIQAVIFEGIDVQIAFQGVHNMVLARVKVSDIGKIASYDIVRDIDYYPDSNDVPALEPELTIEERIVDAVNDLMHPRKPYSADDIMTEFSYQFKDSSTYAVRFVVKDVEYVSIELAEHIGDWLLYSGYYPEPYIFADHKLYTISEAYEGGILSKEQMQELSESTNTLHSEFSLIPYIKGDADGDGECNIIDATVIQRHDADIATGAFYKPLGDVDDDGETNVIDATLIQRSEVGLYTIS